MSETMNDTKQSPLTVTEKVDVAALKRAIRHKQVDEETRARLLAIHQACEDDGSFTVTYDFSKKYRETCMGRLFPQGPSLCQLDRKARNAIAKSVYHDVDMSNAQPSIIITVCEWKGWECKYMRAYVQQREEVLDGIKAALKDFNVTREDAKRIMLSVCNGGTISRFCKERGLDVATVDGLVPKLVRLVGVEAKKRMELIAKEWPDIHEQARKAAEEDAKDPANNRDYELNPSRIKRRAAAILYGSYENYVLRIIKDCLHEQGYKTGTLMFDGLYVERKQVGGEERLPEEVLVAIQERIKQETHDGDFPGMDIKVTEKSMDEEALDLEDESLLEPEDGTEAVVLANWNQGDAGLAKIIGHVCGEVIKRSSASTVLYFEETSCLWKDAITPTDVYDLISDKLHETLSSPRFKRFDGIQAVVKNVRMTKTISAAMTMGWRRLSHPQFEVELDKDPYVLGVRNGVVDLRTGELRERRPEDMVWRVVDVDYDPEEDTSLIEDLVLSCMADEEDMAEFIHELLGYCITGMTCEQIVLFWLGDGRNGKGLLLNACRKLLRKLFTQLHKGVFIAGAMSNDKVLQERAKLIGARFAVVTELKKNDELSVDSLKQASGGDGIEINQKYLHPTTISHNAKFIFGCNDMPIIKGDVREAEKERIVQVPFRVRFTTEDKLEEGELTWGKFVRRRDDSLETKLDSEEGRRALLAYLVAGAVKWYTRAVVEGEPLRTRLPAVVREATRKYFGDQDRFADFLEDVCVVGEEHRVSHEHLHKHYVKWQAKNTTAQVLDTKGFRAEMERRGYKKQTVRVDGARNNGYMGITLKFLEARAVTFVMEEEN